MSINFRKLKSQLKVVELNGETGVFMRVTDEQKAKGLDPVFCANRSKNQAIKLLVDIMSFDSLMYDEFKL